MRSTKRWSGKVLSAYLALVVLVALAGPGFAVYASEGRVASPRGAVAAAEDPAPSETAARTPAKASVTVKRSAAAPKPAAKTADVTTSRPTKSREAAPVTAETPKTVVAPVISVTSLVEPITVPGNPSLGAGGYRVDPVSGSYTFGDIEITITVYSTPAGEVFDFTSNTPLVKVVAKGGKLGANIYNYNPGVLADTGLHAPVNPSGFWADLSHIDLYFGETPPPPEPGSVTVVKYNDIDEDGEMGPNEPVLDGWDFALTPPEGADLTGTSGDDGPGTVLFADLDAGAYSLDETAQNGWHNTTGLPLAINLPAGVDTTIYVGNAEDPGDVTKTFSLTYNGTVPSNTTFWVFYTLEGAQDLQPTVLQGSWLQLSGSGPLTASVALPYGTTILNVDWYAIRGLQEILLGSTDGETLTEDITNPFAYDGDVGGFKFEDVDADGVWDDDELGIEGWNIYLYRQLPALVAAEAPAPLLGFELYDSTVTGVGGAYHFSGVLPGTYYVAEENREGWTMTVGPEGTFVVVNGQPITGLTFGNNEEFLPFTDIDLAITKVADVEAADPGDTITYTLTYRNLGETEASNFTIVDDFDERYVIVQDSAGGVVSDGKITWTLAGPLSMADGPQTITYTVKVIDDMPDGTTNVDNTVVISHPDDHDPSNNSDDERVPVDNPMLPFTPEEPFLPFTGADAMLLIGIAGASAVLGSLLRRRTA